MTKSGYFSRAIQARNALTGLLVFLIPFPRATAPYEIVFYASLALALFLHVSGKRAFSLSSPLSLSFAIFLAWGFVGLFSALDPLNSIHDLYGHFVKYLLLYYLIINSFCSIRGVETLAWIVSAATGVFAGSAVLTHYILMQNPLSSRLGVPAIQGVSSDYIGYITIPGVLLSLMLVQESAAVRGKLIAAALAVVTAVTTICTQSRATLIALGCSLLILYGRKKAAWVAAALVLFMVIYFVPTLSDRFTIQQFTKNERIGLYLTTWHVIRDYPIAGIGFGMQTYGNPDFIDLEAYSRQVPVEYLQLPPIRSPHNTLLDTMVRTGVIGLLIYLYMQFAFMRMGWIVIRRSRDHRIRYMGICVLSVYAAIFIQGLFSDGAFGPQALMLYFAFALMTILWKMVEAGNAASTSADSEGKASQSGDVMPAERG